MFKLEIQDGSVVTLLNFFSLSGHHMKRSFQQHTLYYYYRVTKIENSGINGIVGQVTPNICSHNNPGVDI